jgi:signal transduction histidine kinase/ligand-binding sensor domain-containing protein
MKVARSLSVCTLLLTLVTSARALDPNREIRQLAHRSWGQKEGYPGRTQALAQTTDGFLWLGTDDGLFRFDGVRFERYSPKSGDKLRAGSVSDLIALPDGSLWIAYRIANQICDLRNDQLKCYGKLDGITSNPIAIVQDHEGAIWANTEKGLIRFNGTRWEHIGEAWNFPEDTPHTDSTALFVDSRGTLWVGVNTTVLYLKQGSRRFETTGVFAGWSVSMAETSDGTIWLADNSSYVRAISTSVSAKSAAIARCEVKSPEKAASNCAREGPMVIKVSVPIRLLPDRNGSLWITTDTSGVFRVSHPERLGEGSISKTSDDLQSFSSKDGLSADNCTPVLEDREGNIWVATRDGLDQFRDTALASVLLPTSLSRISIAPADGGDIWVGSRGYVMRIHGNSGEASFVRKGAFKPYSDPAGTAWLIGYSLEQWKQGSFHRVAQAPGGRLGGFGSWQAASDKSGTLWAFFDGRGFFSLDHGRWKAWATPPEVAEQELTGIFSDSTGLIWVSTYEGHVLTMDRGKIIDYSNSPLRYVKVFAEHAPHEIWAGGFGGLAVIDSGKFRLMKPAVVDLLNDVTGIVDAGRDGLWLNATDAVVHISSAEVERALHDPSWRFHSERFDSFDGIPGQPAAYPFATAIQSTDGRIWFAATRGVAWIDPQGTRRRNLVPPPLNIEGITANGKPYDASNGLRLAPHVRDLTIDYTALSFVAPERIHFRYKLDGQDPNWREVVNDREVQYSNLPPGAYRFHVIASNNDGVWNETGASLDFSIAPAYYQTYWFMALCVLAFLALLWALHRRRLQVIHWQYAAGLEASVGERTRIARELHDTLLQSFLALMFQFQAARNLVPRRPEDAVIALDEAIAATRQAIAEGREAITDLRPDPVARRDLSELLNAAAWELATDEGAMGHSPAFHMTIEGTPQTISIVLQDEVYRIAREAIRNAFRHAGASHIEAEVQYDKAQLRLRIRDDGKGIDPKIVADGGRSGHWGIPGLLERSKRIGARLRFWTEEGAGTEVELVVPAALAYEKPQNGRRFRLFRRAANDGQQS